MNPQAHLRWPRLIAALLLAVATAFSFAASPASATASTTTCLGSSPITYSPGLTFTPRPVTYTETDLFSSCISSDPTLTSGISTTTYTVDGSCLGLPEVLSDPGYTVDWNNGQSSTFNLTYTDTIVAGEENVTGVGPVTAGEFLGATGTFVWVYAVLNPLQCMTSQGVTSQNGPLTAEILATS